jgi:hypothetical protein
LRISSNCRGANRAAKRGKAQHLSLQHAFQSRTCHFVSTALSPRQPQESAQFSFHPTLTQLNSRLTDKALRLGSSEANESSKPGQTTTVARDLALAASGAAKVSRIDPQGG